ncbi:unnamed protein product [Blepharisma stoltei]|uniref:Mei2-like C-terminal RNA recognition motif domain-containing protein n=1 Tax=Blepharisma stoltei TaxID=1481888 RepID=A0AAU9JHE2_9CILI|nr:unnamed protein product [Blepharisma stoltei]
MEGDQKKPRRLRVFREMTEGRALQEPLPQIIGNPIGIPGTQNVGKYMFIKNYEIRPIQPIPQDFRVLEDESSKFCENTFHDTIFDQEQLAFSHSSGSATQSPMITVSTEESSRESSDDHRRKPKKRPLDEEEMSLYIVNVEAVERGEDIRTTIMIKNIPNKYTQKMLLQTIDKKFVGTYDFFYLPIDFKNKCNVGYAFIDFIDYRYIPAFYLEFEGKKWERFNSDKICSLAYGRIQGRQALIQHFQSSSVMNQEDTKVKPLILPFKNPNMG